MTPDEVRMLDNRYALLFIRGERPIRDLKYDILHHPNVALTTDGSAPAYTRAKQNAARGGCTAGSAAKYGCIDSVAARRNGSIFPFRTQKDIGSGCAAAQHV